MVQAAGERQERVEEPMGREEDVPIKPRATVVAVRPTLLLMGPKGRTRRVSANTDSIACGSIRRLGTSAVSLIPQKKLQRRKPNEKRITRSQLQARITSQALARQPVMAAGMAALRPEAEAAKVRAKERRSLLPSASSAGNQREIILMGSSAGRRNPKPLRRPGQLGA